MKVDTSKLIFSKAGNLVYRGYLCFAENDMYALTMEDYPFCAEMPTRQSLLNEAWDILIDFIEYDIQEKGWVYLPRGVLRPRKGYEIVEFEISKELTDFVMDFVEAGGHVKYR